MILSNSSSILNVSNDNNNSSTGGRSSSLLANSQPPQPQVIRNLRALSTITSSGQLSLNLALAKQHQLNSISGIGSPSVLTGTEAAIASTLNSTGNLSPSILVNVENGSPSVISINDALTIRHPLLTATGTAAQQTSKPPTSEPSIPQPTPPPPLTTTTSATNVKIESSGDVKKCVYLGNYVFFEPSCSTDTFGTAYNIKNRQPYYWKKFERRDYMKKLEPYFVMEGSCDKIYKFAEIILQSNYTASNGVSSPDAGISAISNAAVGDDQDAVYVVFEPHYGDLHSYMKEKKRLDEPEARLVFRQCVEAVEACHENGIIIRDIKLKKFVFLDPQRTTIGLANLEDCLLLDEDAENDLIKNQQGCPAYVSPEVLNPFQTSYSGKLSDSWSLGIILYTLLVGRYPFHHPTIANMFARIARGKFQVPMPISLSMDARILLRSLIRVKPEERLRADEILAHNWFRQNENESRQHASSVRMMMTATYATNSATKYGLQNQLAATISPLIISKIGLSSSSSSTTTNNNDNTKDSLNDSGRDDCCVPQLPE